MKDTKELYCSMSITQDMVEKARLSGREFVEVPNECYNEFGVFYRLVTTSDTSGQKI